MPQDKQNIIMLLKLISTQTIDLQGFSKRLEKKQITALDRNFLIHLGACLKKIYGKASNFQNDKTSEKEILSSFESALETYEVHASGDILAIRYQPHFDALLYNFTGKEKTRLLKNIEAICDVLDGAESTSQLTLIWSYINAVNIERSESLKEFRKRSDRLDQVVKHKALVHLLKYKRHLYSELKQAWPYPYSIATTTEGRVFLLNKQAESIKEDDMNSDLRLLTQKCKAVNEAITLIEKPEGSFYTFQDHFQQKTRPIIEQIRKPTDNTFLNFMARLFTHPFGFFSKSYATKGGYISKTIESIEEKFLSHKSIFY
ncbi:MAG: hypothetical protein HKM04_08155 [Legionellales bacterium]|nr:hypothetical protein [Legionellales bacterium]